MARGMARAFLTLLCVLWPSVALAEAAVPAGYELAWRRIPEQHRTRVGRLVIDGTGNGRADRKGLVIHLPPAGDGALGVLAHEVGHIVAYSSPEVDGDWRRQFWPGGEIRGQGASGYSRTNPAEDFAEAYQAMIEDGTLSDAERLAFMQTRVFSVQAPTERPAATVTVHAAVSQPSPCGSLLPAGSIVAGCSTVPAGSVRP